MAVRPRRCVLAKGQAIVSCAVFIAMALATIVLCSEQVQAVHVRDSQNVAFVEEEPLAEDAVEDGAATSTSGDPANRCGCGSQKLPAQIRQLFDSRRRGKS